MITHFFPNFFQNFIYAIALFDAIVEKSSFGDFLTVSSPKTLQPLFIRCIQSKSQNFITSEKTNFHALN